MPRRELLTPTERVQLFAFPEDEGELIRLATLARVDLTYIRQHRGDHYRLGLAIQMVYLRHPSRVLPQNEAPFPPLLGIVAAQLKVTPAAWTQYARRDETRREHLQELLDRFELRQFNRTDYRTLIDWLMPLALQTTQGMVLAHAVANELRTRKILLPTIAMIEKICAIALTRAERETFRRLTAGLTDAHRAALDAVLLVRSGGSSSSLSWFRQPPGAPSANARPAVATERLSLTEQGRIRYALKTPYRDGTTHVVFEPLDFLARLAALVPAPRVNLTRFHGVFAPHHRWRVQVAAGRGDLRRGAGQAGRAKGKALGWAQRLKRVFGIDVESCEVCGGAVKIIASIETPEIIEKILRHVGHEAAPCGQFLPRAPPATAGLFD